MPNRTQTVLFSYVLFSLITTDALCYIIFQEFAIDREVF